MVRDECPLSLNLSSWDCCSNSWQPKFAAMLESTEQIIAKMAQKSGPTLAELNDNINIHISKMKPRLRNVPRISYNQ
jgi:hypothetical protein